MTDDAAAAAAPAPRPCNRCKDRPAVYDLRSAERVCPTCFAAFVANKNIKRIEVMQRETRDRQRLAAAGTQPPQQRYLLALSGGPSSTALLHLLHENLAQQRAKTGQRPKFDLVVAHVDADGEPEQDDADDVLAAYRARFPDLRFLRLPLADALALRTVDWDALFPPEGDRDAAAPPSPRAWLAHLFARRLASPSSRADVRRLLVRHLLLAAARREGCDVLLLGCNTTGLAEQTLAETAKGRGFALPWLVNDGAAPVPASLGPDAAAAATTTGSIPVYSPLRELLRAEIRTYHATLDPPLTDLFLAAEREGPAAAAGAGAVVSHKDLSIDEVMRRYFADVERGYPSVVANVVRTTGKLAREGGEAACGLCGVSRDEAGDARWRGELGEDQPPPPPQDGGRAARPLCYGCERSVYG